MVESRAQATMPTMVESPKRAEPHPRLRLQQFAAGTKRRHFLRAIRRTTALGIIDLGVLEAARNVLTEASWSAPTVAALFPNGLIRGGGAVAAFIVGLVFVGAYSSEERWTSPGRVFKGVALGAALATWQSIDSRGVVLTGLQWGVLSVGIGAAIASARSLLGTIVLRYRLAAKATDRVILVGDPAGPYGQKAAEAVLHRRGMKSLGWLSERGGTRNYLGHPSAVWEVLSESEIDTVLLCGDLTPVLFDTVVEAAAVAGCRVLSVRHKGTLMATQPRALNGGDLRMLELTFPARRAGQDVVKRLFDLFVSSVLFVVLLPVLVTLALWVKLDSRGPVFFVQDRVGQAGRVFPMVKFRTMRNGADRDKERLEHLNGSGDPRLFKIPADPRVTRAGQFLRRWSLDELPQLLNVLRGEMSLVGPRPFFESDLTAYDDHHFIRLAVKPGVTGLWQVRGRSTIVDFEEVVRLDRQYIERWSFGLDLMILLQTLPAVLRRTGAY